MNKNGWKMAGWTQPLCVAAACWPVWPWYLGRMADRSTEPWGLVPLVVAAATLWHSRRAGGGGQVAGLLTVPWLILYAVTYHLVPPLVGAGIAVTALTFSLCQLCLGRRFHVGLWALLMLSLPIVATFQFYAGFPLRLLATRAASLLLRAAGLAVGTEGTAITMADCVVSVDAPCSGVKMLWVGGFVFFSLATFRRLTFTQTILAGAGAFCLVLLGNILRATSLFYLESGLIDAPDWAHAGIGVAVFAMTVIGIAGLVSVVSASGPAVRPRIGNRDHETGTSGPARRILFAVAIIAAASAPAWAPTQPPADTGAAFPGWPTTFEGHPLVSQPLSEQEAAFARTFPGRIARFTAGPRALTLRWITRPTRLLHRPEVCFRGEGYAIDHRPLHRDTDGNSWHSFGIEREDRTGVVRCHIYDADGNNWPDVSSWYWAAASGRSNGPWWAVTVCEKSGEGRP